MNLTLRALRKYEDIMRNIVDCIGKVQADKTGEMLQARRAFADLLLARLPSFIWRK